MLIRIEKLTDCARGTWGYFAAVYKNEEFLGKVMTDGTLTAKECYESLKNSWSTDKISNN